MNFKVIILVAALLVSISVASAQIVHETNNNLTNTNATNNNLTNTNATKLMVYDSSFNEINDLNVKSNDKDVHFYVKLTDNALNKKYWRDLNVCVYDLATGYCIKSIFSSDITDEGFVHFVVKKEFCKELGTGQYGIAISYLGDIGEAYKDRPSIQSFHKISL